MRHLAEFAHHYHWTPDQVDQLGWDDFQLFCATFAKMREQAESDEREAARLAKAAKR